MKNNKQKQENYLERIPVKNEKLDWKADENGIVTLSKENKGAFNRLAQLLLKKPKISYIHLDELGSCVWPLIDGERDIISLGVYVKEKFGDKAEPLYERLAKYFKVLESYGFITFRKNTVNK